MPVEVPTTIYMHTSPSGKRYIGQTTMIPLRRWGFGHGYRGCTYFHNAIKKYGWENIEHEILFDNIDQEYANRLETILIGLFRTTEQEHGYNIRAGGHNAPIPDEVRKKMSISHKGKKKPPGFGKLVSERQKGRKGKPATQKTKETARKLFSKPVVCIETGIVYNSMTDAAAFTGCDHSAISKVCRGIKHTCGGYHWKYVNGGNENAS